MAVLELLQAGLAGRLQPTSLQLHAGERVVLLGRSGAGKSTLIGLCNGALQPDQGQLLWKGRPLDQRARRQRCQLGTLWQDLRLVEELTALQNIQAGALGRHGWLWAIRNLLGWLDPGSCNISVQRVGLDQELLHKSVQQLSGGERQRVALARCLAQAAGTVVCSVVGTSFRLRIMAGRRAGVGAPSSMYSVPPQSSMLCRIEWAP